MLVINKWFINRILIFTINFIIMRTRLLFLVLFSIFVATVSCSKDEETVVKVTYIDDAKPIFVASCAPCHVTGGTHPSKFDDFTNAKNKIDVILDRINRDATAAGFMPINGTKLPAATITTLTRWKTDGLLEN